MSLGLILAVAGAGAAGAVVRFGIEQTRLWWRVRRQAAASHTDQALPFPWSTLSANLIGSALFGWVVAAHGAGTLGTFGAIVLGVGFAGALTTYSTFSLDAYLLFRARAHHRAWLYVLGTLFASIAATYAGLAWGGR